MKNNRICAVVTDNTTDITPIAEMIDLFELRIDMVGSGWQDTASRLPKPWIACNRRKEEGGNWQGNEDSRIVELLKALPLGADIIDIELATPQLDKIVPLIKQKTKCLISFHNMTETPAFDKLKDIVYKQIAVGADICKIVTFATKAEDNLTVLRLIPEFPEQRIIAFVMGDKGLSSRILCPLVGGDFTYAALERGAESAAGQISLKEMYEIYRMVK